MLKRCIKGSNADNKNEKSDYAHQVYDNTIVNDSLKTIAKGTGIILTGTFIGSILAVFFPIIIARFFSPIEFGIYALAMTVFLFLIQISSLGLGDGCSRNIAFYRGKQDYKKVKDVIISSFEIVLISGIAACILLFLSADWISYTVFNNEALIMPLRILSFAIPFWLLINMIISTCRGFDSTKENVYFSHLLINGGKFLFVAPVIILAMSFDYIFYAFLANIIMVFLIASFYFKRKIPGEIKVKHTSSSVRKELLVFSFPLIISGMSWFLLQGTDKLMIGYFIDEYNVGLYNVASTISGYLNIFLVSVMFIFQPVGTKLYGAGKNLEIKKLYQTVTKWLFLLASPLIMFVFLAPDVTTSVLFGSRYLEAAFPLLILFMVYSIRISLGPAGGSIIMFGKTKQLMYIVGGTATMNIVLNWFFIPRYGISGAAVATGISILILSFLQLGYLYKISKMLPVKKLYAKIITVFLSLMAVVYLVFQYSPITFSLSARITLIIFSYLLFFVLLIIFNLFSEEDLLIVKLIERKLRIKIPFVRKIIR